MTSGIYAIVCNPTNKVYVGQSINIKVRKGKHVSDLIKNKHCNSYLQNSFNKHGRNSFSFKVLENCERDLLTERESYWIEKYKSNNSEFGFNLKEAGNSPSSIEHKVACGTATIKRNVDKHGLWTIFNLQTGEVFESGAKKEYLGDRRNYNYRKHYLALREWTLQDFKTHYERYNTYQMNCNGEVNKIFSKNLQTGEIKEFPSVMGASRILNIGEGVIRNVVLGRNLSTHGFTFSKTLDFPDESKMFKQNDFPVYILDKDGCRYYESRYQAAPLEFQEDTHAVSYIKDFIDTERTYKGCRFFSNPPTEIDKTVLKYNLTLQEAAAYKLIYENKTVAPKDLPASNQSNRARVKRKLISYNLITQCPTTFTISLT